MMSIRMTGCTLAACLATPLIAHAQSPIPQAADIVAIDNEKSGSRLALLTGGVAKPIFTDRYFLIAPAFSPDGRKIAFARIIPFEHAAINIVVIDRSGKVLSSNFINKYPLAEKDDMNEPIAHPSNLAWMPDGRIAVDADLTSEVGATVIFKPMQGTSLDDGPDLLNADSTKVFDENGEMVTSPAGLHTASVFSDLPHLDSSFCVMSKVKAPEHADWLSHAIEIDGNALPYFGRPILPVTRLVWRDDSTFSVVVMDPNGFEVLSVNAIASTLISGKNGEVTNAPTYSFTKVPLDLTRISSIGFRAYNDDAGRYTILAFDHVPPVKPFAAWIINAGEIVVADLKQVAPVENTAQANLVATQAWLKSAAPLLARAGIRQISAEAVSCRSGPDCASFLIRAARDATYFSSADMIPLTCDHAPDH